MLNRKKYHPKWSLISRLIRLRRANNRCEWCGVQNGILGRRSEPNPYQPHIPTVFTALPPDELDLVEKATAEMKWRQKLSFYKRNRLTIIILTVAHLDRNRTNNRFQNLAALCQRCHLQHDKQQHLTARRYGRNWNDSVYTLDL